MTSIALLLAFAPLTSPAPNAAPTASALYVTSQAEDWAAAVQRGRELIASGQAEEARTLLEQADAADGGQLRTRMWLVRALIEINYLNDALDMIDDLASAGHKGHEIDYLYGMAFLYKARKYITEGVNLSMVGMHFTDSAELLKKATAADPKTYADAFLPLAEGAWNAQQLDVARAAAQHAVDHFPQDAASHFMLGQIAFSEYIVANGDEAQKDAAQLHWQAAFDAFQASAKIDEREGGDVWRLASAFKKSGDALVWKSELEKAAAQYSRAMEFSPNAVDYGQLHSSLGTAIFSAALEEGAKAFEARYGSEETGDASLLWWLGFVRFEAKDYDGARDAFERTFAKWPAAANSKWYIALCNFHQQKPDEAIDSILELQRIDPGALNAAIQGNLTFHLSILDGMVGRCFKANRIADAARLSAAQGNASPDTGRYWNNVGLFYRDAGDNLPAEDGAAKDPLMQRRYYEKALEGYKKALALDPESSVLLNDTAVILHYCLESDLDLAREMYLLSTKRATADLERTDLSAEDRSLIQTALRDSKNNLTRLDALMLQRFEEAAAAAIAKRDAEAKAEAARKAAEEAAKKKAEEEAGGGSGD